MSKITILAFNRKFESVEGYSKPQRRDKIVPVMNTKKVGMCHFCNKPVFGSVGQMLKKDDRGLYSHKVCRKR